MPSLRKKIELDRHETAVHELLSEHFERVGGLEPLAVGFFSQAYAFRADGGAYVVRVSTVAHAAESYAKDEYAARHFASPKLPIPPIVARGAIDDWHYAISERVVGRTLMDCSPVERRALLPALLDTLEALGETDTSASNGYGDWGGDGNGRYASWPAFLADIIEDHDEGYYANWHRFFDESFLERDVYERVYERMLKLSERCPNMRELIHNDYQFENVMTDGERITGVIDWANALYGDPLYDVARLSYLSIPSGWWFDNSDEILRERFGSALDFDARLACYELRVGLNFLRFHARNDHYDDYTLCRGWLLDRIGPDR